MSLSETERQHLILLAKGDAEPRTGEEMHFIKYVLKDPRRVSSAQEIEWLEFLNEKKNFIDNISVEKEKRLAPNDGGREDNPISQMNLEKYCFDCGGKISAKRIEVSPDAIRCIECQRALETEIPETSERHEIDPIGSREDFKKLRRRGN